MRLRYFKGSTRRLAVGTVVTGGAQSTLEHWRDCAASMVLENNRPHGQLDRDSAVLVAIQVDDIELGGGLIDWCCEVKPSGPVSRLDQNWSSEIACLLSAGYADNSEAVVEAARRYWRGQRSSQPAWEYLCEAATVIDVAAFEAFNEHERNDPKAITPWSHEACEEAMVGSAVSVNTSGAPIASAGYFNTI
jgi:hypothetical protein